MIRARSPLGQLLDIVGGLAFVLIVCGLGWGLVGSVAVLVMRWLTGWPA